MLYDRQSLLDESIAKYCPWHPDLVRLGFIDAWETFNPIRETKDEQAAWCAVASGLSDYFGWIATGGVAVVNACLL